MGGTLWERIQLRTATVTEVISSPGIRKLELMAVRVYY
jgi:hypothetical protein